MKLNALSKFFLCCVFLVFSIFAPAVAENSDFSKAFKLGIGQNNLLHSRKITYINLELSNISQLNNTITSYSFILPISYEENSFINKDYFGFGVNFSQGYFFDLNFKNEKQLFRFTPKLSEQVLFNYKNKYEEFYMISLGIALDFSLVQKTKHGGFGFTFTPSFFFLNFLSENTKESLSYYEKNEDIYTETTKQITSNTHDFFSNNIDMNFSFVLYL